MDSLAWRWTGACKTGHKGLVRKLLREAGERRWCITKSAGGEEECDQINQWSRGKIDLQMEEDESKMTPQFLAWMTRWLFVSLSGRRKKKNTNNQKNRQRNRISLEEENGFSLGHVDAQVFMGSIEVQVSS